MSGRIVYSTRWEENDHAESPYGTTIEVVVTDEKREERLEALAKRPGLDRFLKGEVRSHVAVL